MADAASTADANQQRDFIPRTLSSPILADKTGQDQTSQETHAGPYSGPPAGDPSSAHGPRHPSDGKFLEPNFSGPNPFAPNYGPHPSYLYPDPYPYNRPASYSYPYIGDGAHEPENVDGYKVPQNPFQTQDYPAPSERGNRPFWLDERDMSAEKKALIHYPPYPPQGYPYYPLYQPAYGAPQAQYGLQQYHPQQGPFPVYLPEPEPPQLAADQSRAVADNHDVVWHHSTKRDVTVHLEIDIEKDINSALDEFLRIKRFGGYRDAEEFFQLHLVDELNYLPVTVEYADMLLRQGAYKALLESVDDEEILDLCGELSIEELRATTGEEISLLLITSLARSKRIPNISMAAEVLSIASKFMETRNMAKLTSIEVQIYCHCLELAHHISQGSNLDISLQTAVLDGLAGGKSLNLKELYQTLVREKRIWDLRDLVVGISSSSGPYEACKAIVGVVSPSIAIPMVLHDWESLKHDDLGNLAMLDILTCICAHVVNRAQENEDQSIMLQEEVVFEQARITAESLQEQNSSEITTRSYLEWVIMKEKRSRVLGTLLHGKDEQQKNSSASSLGLSQYPGITLWLDPLPIYVPIFPLEQHSRPGSEEVLKRLPEVALRSVLTASTKLGAYETQSACHQELIHRARDPTDLFSSLESLECTKMGSPMGLLKSRLSKYLHVDDKTSAEKLSHDLFELDPRLWKDFEHPLLEWAYWRVRWALDKTTGRDRVWESTGDWKEKFSEDADLPDGIIRKLEKLGIASSARHMSSLPAARRGRITKSSHKDVNLGGIPPKGQGSGDKVSTSFDPEAQRSGNGHLRNPSTGMRGERGKSPQSGTIKDREQTIPQQERGAETNIKRNSELIENEDMKQLQREKIELEKKLKAFGEERASLETHLREKLFGDWMKQKQELDRELQVVEKLRLEAFQAREDADARHKQSEKELITRVKAETQAEMEAAREAEEGRRRRHAEETARLERLLHDKLEYERRNKLELDAKAACDKAKAEKEAALFKQKIVEETKFAAEQEVRQKLELERAQMERDMSQHLTQQLTEEIRRLQEADSEWRTNLVRLPLTRTDYMRGATDGNIKKVEENGARWKGKEKERKVEERIQIKRRRRDYDSDTDDTGISIVLSPLTRIREKISSMWQSVSGRRKTGSTTSGSSSNTTEEIEVDEDSLAHD